MTDDDEAWIRDVVCLSLPKGADPSLAVDDDGKPTPALLEVVQRVVMRQYAHPPRALLLEVDVMVTDDPAEAEQFQPAHECPACLAGNDQARAHLAANPGTFVVLGNLTYKEIW